MLILKENQTLRNGKIVELKERKPRVKSKKKHSKIFKQYKHLFS